MKRNMASVAAVAALAMASYGSLSDASVREIERNAPRPIEGNFIICALCGHGGGTLVNDNGDKSRKVHKKGHCW